ncbi:MAG: 3-hydroxybutyryl-CoA dehydrogenase [Acidimicrobiia bacterium]
MNMAIESVGIVGGGLMGGGIAEVCAKAGVRVTVVEMDQGLAVRSKTATTRSLDKAVDRGKLDQSARDAALGFLSYSTDLTDLSGSDLVIEAIVEDAAIKRDLFGRLDEIVTSQDAVLASNTSSIPITQIASATSRPHAVVGMHFFNPAPIMPLVEVISTVVADQRFVDRASEFAAETLGKTVVHAGDRAGFIVNKLLCPYLFESIRMFEEGFATREDIDAAMVNGAGYPMGPLALADLIGNDTLLAVADAFMDEYKDVRFAAPPLLRRMVEAGLLGRKAGRGFYDYS